MSKKKKKQNLSNRIFAYIMLFLAVAFSLTTVLSLKAKDVPPSERTFFIATSTLSKLKFSVVFLCLRS